MNEDEVRAALDTMADFQSQLDALNLEKQTMIDAVLTPEIKQRLEEIDDEFADKGHAAHENIAALTATIKAAVLELGASVKGKFLHAVWAKGRVSWDDQALRGYAEAHPELHQFRKQGEPSVSLRTAKP